jgi:NAD(P)-dependent dehydrogenase (short-subunit alcohol dehydrogenase family)
MDRPRDETRDFEGRGLLTGARALITGGDSGIGRAALLAYSLAQELQDRGIGANSVAPGPA